MIDSIKIPVPSTYQISDGAFFCVCTICFSWLNNNNNMYSLRKVYRIKKKKSLSTVVDSTLLPVTSQCFPFLPSVSHSGFLWFDLSTFGLMWRQICLCENTGGDHRRQPFVSGKINVRPWREARENAASVHLCILATPSFSHCLYNCLSDSPQIRKNPN